MLKKVLPVILCTFIFSCSSNDLVLDDPNLLKTDSMTQSVDKNGLFSYSISEGSVTFLKRTYNGSAYTWKDSFTPTPERVSIGVKKMGLQVAGFHNAQIKTPKKELYVEFLLGNDSFLYIKDVGGNDYYKIGSWSKSGKFKGESYIKTFDPSDSNWIQDFNLKIDNLDKINILESGEFYNKKKTLYVYLKNDLNSIKKDNVDFNLKYFIKNK